MVTGPEAGITRDSIGLDWEWRGRKVKLFDTAGIRKRAKVEEKLEKLAVSDALRAVKFAEVVVLLLDATIPFEKQDLSIMGLIDPPVGINVFIVKGLVPDVPMSEIFIGVLPFWLAMMVCIAILIAFPEIATFIPDRMIK